MDQSQFMLVLKFARMSSTASLNGVPLYVDAEPGTRTTAKELSAVVGGGVNRLVVQLGTGPGLSAYNIAVFRKAGDGSVTQLASARGTSPTTETLEFSGPANLELAAAGLEGNDADKGVSNEARDEITAVLARMHAAVSNGNPDDLVSLLREKIARQVSAVGETVVGATATQRSTIEALIEHRATLAPLRPGALQFHSVRSGQEVRVCDAEGRGPIVVALPDASISMCPSFALIDGAWVVVR